MTMSRSDDLLQRFRVDLQAWSRTIQRGVGATDLVFHPVKAGGFRLEVKWKDGGSYDHTFTKAEVFGPNHGEVACEVQKLVCCYAKDFMHEVLAVRGAL